MIGEFSVTVDEVKKHIHAGDPLFFINLRHHSDWDTALIKARGALRLPDDDVAAYLDEIPHDRPVIIYSTCPGDEQSEAAARMLKEKGWADVHALIGGFKSYVEAGLPVETIDDRDYRRKVMLL